MILDELAAYIATTGVGYSTIGTDIFRGFMPDNVDSCLVIYETGGLPTTKGFAQTLGTQGAEWPRIAIHTRGVARDHHTPRTNMKTVVNRLDGLAITLSGIRYLWIEALHPPLKIDYDKNERVIIGCNFQVAKELS